MPERKKQLTARVCKRGSNRNFLFDFENGTILHPFGPLLHVDLNHVPSGPLPNGRDPHHHAEMTRKSSRVERDADFDADAKVIVRLLMDPTEIQSLCC